MAHAGTQAAAVSGGGNAATALSVATEEFTYGAAASSVTAS